MIKVTQRALLWQLQKFTERVDEGDKTEEQYNAMLVDVEAMFTRHFDRRSTRNHGPKQS